MGDPVDEFITKHRAADTSDPVDAFMAKHYGTVPEPKRGPLTMADGSPAPNDWAPVEANVGGERVEWDDEKSKDRKLVYSYEKFRLSGDSVSEGKRKASDDEQTRINNLPYLERAGRRSLDAAIGATAGAVDRGIEIAGGVVDWAGATVKNVLTGNDYNQQQTDEIRARQADRRANNGIGKALDRLEAQDTGGSVGTARTAGRMAADLGTMALPGAAGIHGAAGFAAGSVLTDPENPLMSATSGALAYAGMKGGGALLAKPIAAILERTAGKFLPETQRFLAKALTGVAEGAGMSAAPHVTKDGLHSALIGAIQGNPDDRVAAATNILLVAAFRAYGREIPTPVAEAYVRGDFARVPKSLRPLMDSISGPIERAAGEVREMELRPDRPRRFEADMERARSEGEAQRARARGEVERDDGSGFDRTPEPEATAKAVNDARKGNTVSGDRVSDAEAFSPERVAVKDEAIRRGEDPVAAVESTPTEVRPDGSVASKAGLPTEQAIADGHIDPKAVPLVRDMNDRGVETVSSGIGEDGKPFAIGIDKGGETVVERGDPAPPRPVEAAPEAPPVKAKKPASKKQVSDAFAELADNYRDDIDHALGIWNDSVIGRDGRTIRNSTGRDRTGGEGIGKSSKQSFMDWLFSDAKSDPRNLGPKTARDLASPFDDVASPDLVSHQDWIEKINRLRDAARPYLGESAEPSPVEAPVSPPRPVATGEGKAPKPARAKKAATPPPETLNLGGERKARLVGTPEGGEPVYVMDTPSGPTFYERNAGGRLKTVSLSATERWAKAKLAEPKPDATGPVLMMNREGVTKAAGAVANATKRTFGSFIERIRSRGTPTSIEVADKADAAVDLTKKKLGEASAEIDAALGASGGIPGTAKGRAATSVSRPSWVEGKDYGTSTLYDLIEGRSEPRTPEEAAIRDRGRELIDKLGRMSEDSKVQQFDPSSGEWDFFKNIPGGKVAPRIMSPDFQDVMLRGPSGDLWRKVIDAFADINGIPKANVEKAFMDRHESMVGGGPDATVKESQVEFRRQWRQVPTAIRHNGQTFDLFESNPYTYFKRLAESRAARLAVIDAFGQDIPARETISGGDTDALMGGERPAPEAPPDGPAALRKKFASEVGNDEDFTALMRGLHGGAIRKPILDPGSPASTIVRGVNQALKVIKTTMLSASAVQNIPEPLGSTSALVGMPTVAKRAWQMLRQTAGWKADRAAAEVQGAITRDIANLSFDPTRQITSGIRMFSELGKRAFGHGQVNESQESLAAVSSGDMAKRMAGGKGREIDVQRMKATGTPDALARRLADGTATPAEYDAFVRRAPGQVVGANLSPAEQSSWEANRAVKALSAFARYSWMSARGAANQAKAYLTTMNSVISDTSLTPQQRWSRSIAAHRAVAEYGVGKALQGSAAYLIASFVTGGTTGLKIAASEAADNPLKFARDSFFYATFGGPIGAAVRIASGKEEIENAVFPVFIGKEVWKLFGGNSDDARYRDKDFGDRLWEFTKRVTPVYRAAETALVAIGFGSEQAHDIDTAKRAFYRWKMDSPRKGPQFIPGETTEGQKVYKDAIREAYEAVKRGDTPDVVNEHIMRALGIHKKSDVKQSIRAKKLLDGKDMKPRLGELKARIGDDAYKLLELHDELLERLAKTVSTAK